jgi:diguanylate cyclase (GGDEF)-like protein/PAS domain S-box-containing protein
LSPDRENPVDLTGVTSQTENLPRFTDGGTESFYRRILDSLADGVYFVDKARRITYWNHAAETISGYAARDVIGRSCADNLLVHTNSEGCGLCTSGCPLQFTILDGATREAEAYMKHRNGHRVPVSIRLAAMADDRGEIIGGVEVFSDNSSKLAALEKASEMEALALIDPLTLVGNRRYTERSLREQWAVFDRDGESFGVLLLDLDHFKHVNDTYGHDAGDAVLQAAARTIVNNLRSFDFLGRWGGEEFVAILPKANAAPAAAVAERCCALLRSCRVEWAGHTIRPTVSIGVTAVQPGDSPGDLITRADEQLYLAKRGGRDQFRVADLQNAVTTG